MFRIPAVMGVALLVGGCATSEPNFGVSFPADVNLQEAASYPGVPGRDQAVSMNTEETGPYQEARFFVNENQVAVLEVPDDWILRVKTGGQLNSGITQSGGDVQKLPEQSTDSFNHWLLTQWERSDGGEAHIILKWFGPESLFLQIDRVQFKIPRKEMTQWRVEKVLSNASGN